MGALPRCYVASPLGFTESGRDWYASTLLPLLARYFEIVDPWALVTQASIEEARASGELREYWLGVGRRNFDAIDSCRYVVAVLDGDPPDIGTVAEVAWAAARGKRVIGYRSDIRQSGEEAMETNLMIPAAIELSGGRILGSSLELESYLSKCADSV